jgi:hypothetical protein
MRSPCAGRSTVGEASHGIDRMVRNVETGCFERSLSAFAAAGALVTAAEIFFEHDSASFGNKMMWVPVYWAQWVPWRGSQDPTAAGCRRPRCRPPRLRSSPTACRDCTCMDAAPDPLYSIPACLPGPAMGSGAQS